MSHFKKWRIFGKFWKEIALKKKKELSSDRTSNVHNFLHKNLTTSQHILQREMEVQYWTSWETK